MHAADPWWAGDFACDPSDLRPAKAHVQAHAGRMAGATGIWILVVGEAPLVSLPPSLMVQLAASARAWSNTLVADPAALAEALEGVSFSKIVGPAWIGYPTEGSRHRMPASRARVLTQGDMGAVARLRSLCAAEAWEHGGSDPASMPTFGTWSDPGELVALAGYKVWGESIAHIYVVTAPAHQGRGHASAVVSCAAQHALQAGLLPQFRTLASNEAAMRVAMRLGFETYGFSVYVRVP